MADDQFLSIPSIPGEVVGDRHPGAIDVLSWSWAVSNTTLAGQGAGAGRVGKPTIADIALALRLDKATPKLFDACARSIRLDRGARTEVRPQQAVPRVVTSKLPDQGAKIRLLTGNYGGHGRTQTEHLAEVRAA
ncbi:type VI secretion system tube protein Hcp [Microbacterium sp. NPDC078428]|uniref:type VI secretion system tube protein Hcp n=1 Tax=Microbacterium sp. NPDC078428 TaxID=3364190 RepID=UPI0037CACC55